MRKLELLPFDKNWTENFKEESKRIKEVYGRELLKTHHI